MSNAGQAALGIVGGVVGFFIGGPTGAAYGFQLGLLAGSALFPTQLPAVQGPRLGDGQQTVSSVGAPIPNTHGAQTVGGIIIWASPIREEATTQSAGGKGAPEQEQTTYRYFRSFAILLTDTTDDYGNNRPIGGIRRILANGKPIYDLTADPDSPLDDILADAFTGVAQAFVGAQATTTEWAQKMTIYTGTEDQLPDPVIESFEGAGNVPAFRGYSYVVFDDVELRAEDGNRIPASWKFEVYEEATGESGEYALYAQEVLYDWASGEIDPRDLRNTHTYLITSTPNGAPAVNDLGPFDELEDAFAQLEAAYNRSYSVIAHELPFVSSHESIQGGATAGEHQESDRADLHCLHKSTGRVLTVAEALQLPTVTGCAPGRYYTGGHWATGNQVVELSGRFGESAPAAWTEEWDSGFGGCNQAVYSLQNVVIQCERLPSPPPSPCVYQIPGSSWCVTEEGILAPNSEWEYDDSTTYRVLRVFSGSTNNTRYPIGPARPLGHPDYSDQAFWEEAYERARLRGDIEAGLVYGVDYPEEQSFGYRMVADLQTQTAVPISLATIVARICERVGLANYDVTDLEDRYVIGYQTSRQMTARGAIEPLRSVGFFDVIEDGIQLAFPTRGKDPVVTLEDEDLGAFFVGEERPSKITTQSKQELELPRMVRVHYQHPGRDYEPGEERSPERFDTSAESAVDIDLAVAMDPDAAAQCAEVIARDLWAARVIHQTSLDIAFGALQPADAILVPVDGQLHRVRIPSITDRLPNLRALDMIRDDDGNYVSTAVGSEPGTERPRIEFLGPVGLLLLDLPPLEADHDDAGVYAAAYPALFGGVFRSAVISRSQNGGATYTVAGAISTATPVGTLLQALATGPTEIFDEGNELYVEMLGEVTLESRTEADVLDGANAAVIGAHGRWEILQFKNAEEVVPRIWRLTGLLRGRRGTEHNMGTSEIGDRFAMISLGNLARLPMETVEVGAERLYLAVQPGQATGLDAQAFTSSGEALRPFSPTNIVGELDDDGNLSITWTRRDRFAFTEPESSEVPMSESVLDFEVDIVSAGEVRRTISVSAEAATYTAEQQIVDFGAVQRGLTVTEGVTLETAATRLRVVGGELCGVSDLHPIDDSGSIVKFNAAGVLTGRMTTDVLSNLYTVTALIDDGDDLYVAAISGSEQPYVWRIQRADIGLNVALNAAAEYEPSMASDPQGLAIADGALWVAESYSAQLARLNLSTLVLESTVALSAGIGAMATDGIELFVANRVDHTIERVTAATGAVGTPIPCVDFPVDVLVVGDLLFVAGSTAVGVYSTIDGGEIGSVSYEGALFRQALAYDGTFVFVGDPSSGDLIGFSTTTGLPLVRYTVGDDLFGIGGVSSQGLFFEIDPDSERTVEYLYELGGSGLTVRVYQISQAVGRGNAGEATL